MRAAGTPALSPFAAWVATGGRAEDSSTRALNGPRIGQEASKRFRRGQRRAEGFRCCKGGLPGWAIQPVLFLVDCPAAIWQWSSMARPDRDTHHTVSAGIMESIGKGFLIATAGMLAGAMFGTANLSAIGMWTTLAAAASGVACMVGSALVRNAGYDRCELDGSGSPEATKGREAMTAVPGVEAAGEIVSEERWARRMAATDRKREHATGRGG